MTAALSPVALLVTGSRSLAKSRAAEAWAERILSSAVLELPRDSVVIHGGANGPDSWAHTIALYRPDSQVTVAVYRPNGSGMVVPVAAPGRIRRPMDFRWNPGDPGPLARNAHMVEVVLSDVSQWGYAPRVLALVDADSRTRGTDHTVRLARAAGIPVDRHEWRSILPLGGAS